MSDIIKAQQGLARKAKAQPDHQFRDLYFLLSNEDWIAQALHKVLSNSGAKTPGVDGITRLNLSNPALSEVDNARTLSRFVAQLQAELKAGNYQPCPVRKVEIPKPGSIKKRPLGIRTIKDRVVATLLKMVLEPIWESDFMYFSNGFRPTRCTMDCVQPLYTLTNSQLNYRWVIEGDIRNCFGAIPHQALLREVVRRIADKRILQLINRFLKSGIMRLHHFYGVLEAEFSNFWGEV
jgi:RNA-directed DNA polymerase